MARTRATEASTALTKEQKVAQGIENTFNKWFSKIDPDGSYNVYSDGTTEFKGNMGARQKQSFTDMASGDYGIRLNVKQKKILEEQLKGIKYDNRYKKMVGDLADEGFTVNDSKMVRAVFKIAEDNGWLEDRAMIIALFAQLALSKIF